MIEERKYAIGHSHLRAAQELLARAKSHVHRAETAGVIAPNLLRAISQALSAVRVKLLEEEIDASESPIS